MNDMKHIRLQWLMLLTMWLAIGANAQQNRLFIPDFTMVRGGESMLSVYMDNVDEVTAVEFTLEVPEGFSVNHLSAIFTERAKNHQMTARKLKNGKYKFVIMSDSNTPFDGISGLLLTMRINAAESVTDEMNYPIIISDAVMALKSGKNVLQEAKAGNIIIKSLPNLHVVSVECPVANTPITVKWKVRNDGRGATGNVQWKDYVWLVPNVTFGTESGYEHDPVLLATVDNMMALRPSESYENQVIVNLQERVYGVYDLLVTSDMYHVKDIDFSPANGVPPYPYKPEDSTYGFLKAKNSDYNKQVEEDGENDGKSDNFFYKQINIAVPPLPDLQVTNITVEVIPLGNISLGQTLPEDYLEATMPTPLTAAGVAHNSIPYSGKKIRVTATVANNGDAAIISKTWNNALYMSASEDRNSSDFIGLSLETLSNVSLQPGESTTVSFVTKLPYELSGDIYFHVNADTDDEIYELANKANNWGCSSALDVLLTPGADFLPRNLQVPSVISLGSAFSISYDVNNIGPGVPYNIPWKDKVYISTENILNDEAVEIGSFIQGGSWIGKTIKSAPVSTGGMMIRPAEEFHFTGDNYSANRNLTISNLATGTYYLFVKVDADNNVYEYNGEDNNIIGSGPFQIVAPDLSCELLKISEETLTTGQTVAFSWKLKNIGAGDIINVNVKDEILVSSNIDGSNLIKIGEVSNSLSIVSGGEKTLRANVKIPSNSSLAGRNFVFVKTNVDNIVTESNKSNNLSVGIERDFRYISPDNPNPAAEEYVKGMNITVTNLTAPKIVTPDQQIPVSYQVKNTGDLTVNKDVTNEVYISDSESFDTSSATLCTTSDMPASVNGLESGSSISTSLNVVIPSNIEGGSKYLHVILNRNNQLSEKVKDDNVVSIPIFINGNLPDFTVTDLDVPSVIMTAEPTSISWTLKNEGSWDAAETYCWVYLSEDNVFSVNDKQLASVKSKALPKGGCETMTTSINLDDNLVGNYYLIVIVNNDNSIEESDNDNNTTTASCVSKQSPLPDLEISDLSVEGTLRPGNSITVNATVKNVGDSHTRKDKWSDAFYLSAGSSINESDIVGSKAHVGKLALIL